MKPGDLNLQVPTGGSLVNETASTSFKRWVFETWSPVYVIYYQAQWILQQLACEEQISPGSNQCGYTEIPVCSFTETEEEPGE